jgi:hypothetical protein
MIAMNKLRDTREHASIKISKNIIEMLPLPQFPLSCEQYGGCSDAPIITKLQASPEAIRKRVTNAIYVLEKFAYVENPENLRDTTVETS